MLAAVFERVEVGVVVVAVMAIGGVEEGVRDGDGGIKWCGASWEAAWHVSEAEENESWVELSSVTIISLWFCDDEDDNGRACR